MERDSSGRIVSAKAAYVKLIGRMNGKAATQANIDINNAVGEYVSVITVNRVDEHGQQLLLLRWTLRL